MEAWLAFRKGEQVFQSKEKCVECRHVIPPQDDYIEQFDHDGTLEGRICEKCCQE